MSFFSGDFTVTGGAPVQIIVGGSNPDQTVYICSNLGVNQFQFGYTNTTAVFPAGIAGNPSVFVLPGGWDLWIDTNVGNTAVAHVFVTRA